MAGDDGRPDAENRPAASAVRRQHRQRLRAAQSSLIAEADAAVRAAAGRGLNIAAVGGYGAGVLAPYSDLDVLILLPERSEAYESLAADTVTALWNSGRMIGHGVRTFEESTAAAADDAVLADSLLNARPLWGDAATVRRLRETVKDNLLRTPAAFIAAKFRERAQRLTKQSSVRCCVEPDLKNGKGGLRDVQLITRLLLCAPEALLTHEKQRLQRARHFLQQVRHEVHALHGRACDVLTFAVQPGVAEALGEHDVFALMRKVFRALTEVSLLLGLCSRAVESAGLKAPEKVTENVHPTAAYIAADIEAAHVAAVVQRRAAVHRPGLSESAMLYRYLPQARDPEKLLRRLRDVGLLQKIWPAFKRIAYLTQADMYHRYAVADHVFKAVGAGCRLVQAPPPGVPAPDPKLLLPALLFHDIGKGGGGCHDTRGARIAAAAAKAAGETPLRCSLIADAVRLHLHLSLAADRRDPDDPQTLRDLRRLIPEPMLLNLLFGLTLADISAVSTTALTARKTLALRRLYDDLHAAYIGRPHRAALPAPSADDRNLRVRVLPDLDGSGARAVICVPDRIGLFRAVAGALMRCGASIMTAHVNTLPDGTAFDVFTFTEADGRPVGGHGRLERIHETLLATLAGPDRAPPAIASRSSAKTAIASMVTLCNATSDTCTVIEVSTADRQGLLYLLLDALSGMRLSVQAAFINTYGRRAVDVFYVKSRHGRKITDGQALDKIRNRLYGVAVGNT